MMFVVFGLYFSSAVSLSNRSFHGIRDLVRVKNDHPVYVSGRPSRCLNQRSFRPEESLLIRVKYGHQGYLRDVQPLPKQVDSHKHIEFPLSQFTDKLAALHGFYVRVEIPDPYAHRREVFCEFFRHPFGQCGDKDPVTPGDPGAYFFVEVIHLC